MKGFGFFLVYVCSGKINSVLSLLTPDSIVKASDLAFKFKVYNDFRMKNNVFWLMMETQYKSAFTLGSLGLKLQIALLARIQFSWMNLIGFNEINN